MKVFYSLLSLPPPMKSIHCQLFVLFSFVFCVFIKYIWRSFLNVVNISVTIKITWFSSVAQSCPTLCDPMNCSMSGFSVHHQLSEFTQTHVHWVSDAIQLSHPLSSPSPCSLNPWRVGRIGAQSFPASGAFQMSQFFASGGQITGASASVLPMNIQDWFPSGLAALISLQYKELSRVFSNTTVQKYQFFSTQLSLWSNSHIHTWLLEKP